MNDKIDLTQLMTDFQSELQETKDIKEALENILVQNVDDIKDFVDTEKIISELVKSTQPLSTIKNLSDSCKIDDILENTLNQFEHIFEDETINVFKELIKYDKTIIVNDVQVFIKIYSILQILNLHKISIEKLDELENENSENRGIAKTKLKVNEAIQPRINTFKNANKYNKIPVNELSHRLYEEFDKEPREINAMLETLDTSTIKNIEKSLLDTLDNQQVFLNSSESIEDIHIFKSAQIYCFTPYKKENNKEFTKEKLAKYSNQILNDFFEYEYNSNLNRNHISKPIQHKTYFNQIAILEFQTPKNIKKHPIFY